MKTLRDLLDEHLLKPHKASPQEIRALFKIVRRDMKDALIPYLSPDRKFATAYNAALQLATIVLRAHGYRSNPSKAAHHRISIQALPLILGKEAHHLSLYFDSCRIKRNMCEYTSADEASEKDVKEILKAVQDFERLVHKWLSAQHAALVAK